MQLSLTTMSGSKPLPSPSLRSRNLLPKHKTQNARSNSPVAGPTEAEQGSLQPSRTDVPPPASVIERILLGMKIDIAPLELALPNEEPTKYSLKKNGIIHAYSANTNQGIIRNYNEDRVSIILNIVKPKGKE